MRAVKGSEHARGFGGMPPHEIFLKANPSFRAYLKKVELAKKESIFSLLIYKKWFESDTSNPFDKV